MAKFLNNRLNKSQLIALLKSTFEENYVFVEESKTDAETLVVMEALHARGDRVVEVVWIVEFKKIISLAYIIFLFSIRIIDWKYVFIFSIF